MDDDVRAVAALREENARLKTANENAVDYLRRQGAVGEWGDNEYTADLAVLVGWTAGELARLRAHVAALVHALRDAYQLIPDPDYAALLNAPDLAALVTEAQARDDIVRAADDLTDSGWHGAERLAAAVQRWRGLDAARGPG